MHREFKFPRIHFHLQNREIKNARKWCDLQYLVAADIRSQPEPGPTKSNIQQGYDQPGEFPPSPNQDMAH